MQLLRYWFAALGHFLHKSPNKPDPVLAECIQRYSFRIAGFVFAFDQLVQVVLHCLPEIGLLG